jgi:hypothetical protein
MATHYLKQPEDRVTVLNGEVRIEQFVETDPNVYRVLSESESPEQVAHVILRIGAQATLVAQADLEAQVVEQRFEGMARAFDQSLDAAVAKITDLGHRLLDEDEGSLPHILGDVKAGIEGILDETFDEDSKSSAIAKIDGVLKSAVQRLDASVRETLDPESSDSGLAKAKREIVETVKEQAKDLRKEVQDIALALAAKGARTEVAELTAIKGFSFEQTLECGLVSITKVHGDTAERVGTKTGASGTKSGDELVTINPEDTCGQEARFILECKDRRLSMPKTMEELDKALSNHDAQAGIAVFSRQEYAPTPLPFSWSGNRAILVYNKEAPDEDALQLAYAWARWLCRRDLTAQGDSIDVARIEAALLRARQALARQQSARSCFTTATKKIHEGAEHVSALVEDVQAALADLWDELNAA